MQSRFSYVGERPFTNKERVKAIEDKCMSNNKYITSIEILTFFNKK